MSSTNVITSLFEQDLLVQIANDDQTAFKKLYDNYRSRVYSLALSILKNAEDSEDILVEVFTSLWNKRHNLPKVENISSYIYTITKNRSLNLYKKKANQNLHQQSLIEENYFDSTANSVETDLYFKETYQVLNSIVEKLPQQQRQVFDLIKLQGFQRKEIANKLDLSENTVRNHLNAAIKTIKIEFEQQYKHLLPIFFWLFLK